jgi:hypothetical protein
VLRDVVVHDALDETRLAVLQLRAQLAAQVSQWDEVRELMTIAVDKKSPELVLAITEELRKANRTTEALNFLTQAERAMKGTEERFTLRLEQLRFYALDKTWSPSSGRAQVASLFRTGGRNEATLKRLAAWFEEQKPAAKDWLTVLRTEARSGNDPALAALALCALSEAWPSTALPDEVAHAWNRNEEKDRPCIQIAASVLLKHGKPALAAIAGDALRATPSGLQSRLLPIAAEIAGAMKDEVRLRELYAEVVRMPFPGGTSTKDWAAALETHGHADWARELFELAREQTVKTNKPNPQLTQAQIEFLIRQRDFEGAESLLAKNYSSFMPEAAKLIVKLYRDWGRLDQLDHELPKFFLPEGVTKEVKFLAGRKDT